MKARIYSVLTIVFWLLCVAVTVYASGGEGGEHGSELPLGIDFRVIAVQAMGFVVVFLVLKRFLFAPLTKVMEERRENIRTTLDKIGRDKSEMERLKTDYEARLADIESKARLEIQNAVKKAELLGEEIKAARRSEAEQMLEKARTEIEHEREKSLISLRQDIAGMALTLSGRLINKELDQNKHRDLISQFISELDKKVDTAKL